MALAEPVKRELNAQSVELRNCETDTELRRPLASEVEIQKQISIAEEVEKCTNRLLSYRSNYARVG